MTQPPHLIRQAFLIANASVVCDIESEGVAVVLGGWVFYDTRPMVDANEHGPEVAEMLRQAIDYALSAGLAMRHPTQPHLLRLLTLPA